MICYLKFMKLIFLFLISFSLIVNPTIAYSKAKRSEYIEKLKKQRTEQFRKQKESFLSGNTPSEKRKSI